MGHRTGLNDVDKKYLAPTGNRTAVVKSVLRFYANCCRNIQNCSPMNRVRTPFHDKFDVTEIREWPNTSITKILNNLYLFQLNVPNTN
jgi:hypothetical protein